MSQPKVCLKLWACLSGSDFLWKAKMQRWIIMGLAFFTLALVNGCSKSEKEKCEAKGDNWSWDSSDKKCKEKKGEASTGGASTAEIPTGAETPEVVTQEACKLKKRYKWDSNSAQCKEMEYLFLIVPYVAPGDKVLLGYSLYDHESINDYEGLLGVRWQLGPGVCIKIHKFDLFRIRVVVRRPVDRTKTWKVTEDINVCIGESKRGTDTDVRCSVGVYEIDGVRLKTLSPDKGSTCLHVFDPSQG